MEAERKLLIEKTQLIVKNLKYIPFVTQVLQPCDILCKIGNEVAELVCLLN